MCQLAGGVPSGRVLGGDMGCVDMPPGTVSTVGGGSVGIVGVTIGVVTLSLSWLRRVRRAQVVVVVLVLVGPVTMVTVSPWLVVTMPSGRVVVTMPSRVIMTMPARVGVTVSAGVIVSAGEEGGAAAGAVPPVRGREVLVLPRDVVIVDVGGGGV